MCVLPGHLDNFDMSFANDSAAAADEDRSVAQSVSGIGQPAVEGWDTLSGAAARLHGGFVIARHLRNCSIIGGSVEYSQKLASSRAVGVNVD